MDCLLLMLYSQGGRESKPLRQPECQALSFENTDGEGTDACHGVSASWRQVARLGGLQRQALQEGQAHFQ